MELKGTKTEKNLQKALQGEALAHLKYQWYKSQLSNLSKEYEKILDEIVHNEKEHGKIWFKALHNGEMPNDLENLLDSYEGEKLEHLEMYPHFSRVAEEEGFKDISRLFYQIGLIEGYHMEQFQQLREHLDDVHKSSEEVVWKCLNCGYKVKGEDAPLECPVCNHQRKYFTKTNK